MIKKIVKIFMVMLLLISTVQFLNVFDVSAKSIKFSGVYKKNSKKAKYYLELRQYDMPDDSGFVGNYWFVPKKAGYVEHHEEFKKKSKNMYVDKCGKMSQGGYKLTFKVYKNRVVVKQYGTVLRGVNFSGTYKLKKRFHI